MRYKNNTTKKTIDKRMVYVPKILPDIPETPFDTFIATETGDRLDTLAFLYYKDSALWWIIAAANNIHNASLAFPDGTILRIPANPSQIITLTTR